MAVVLEKYKKNCLQVYFFCAMLCVGYGIRLLNDASC